MDLYDQKILLMKISHISTESSNKSAGIYNYAVHPEEYMKHHSWWYNHAAKWQGNIDTYDGITALCNLHPQL